MAGKHGGKQQKRLAKQKARRKEKRSVLARRSSRDPTQRLQRVEKYPIIRSLASISLWDEGIGYLVIAREEPEGGILFATFLVDVFCLGVKNAFWEAGTLQEFREMVRKMDEVQSLSPIGPACLAKIVEGAVAYAHSLGFSPHPDYRHASRLLEGIDPSTCPDEFAFGQDGKPCYIQGPNESPAQVMAIVERMREVGGHFLAGLPGGGPEILAIEDDLDEDDEDDGPEEAAWTWQGPGSWPGGRG